MKEPGRLYLTFPQAVRVAKVDSHRLARWMANGEVSWAFDDDGVVWISAETIPSDGELRSRGLEVAVTL